MVCFNAVSGTQPVLKTCRPPPGQKKKNERKENNINFKKSVINLAALGLSCGTQVLDLCLQHAGSLAVVCEPLDAVCGI